MHASRLPLLSRRGRGPIVLLVLLAGLFAPAAVEAQTPGASYVVNTTADGTDVTPGDGICDVGGGVCTLRAAIEDSNAVNPDVSPSTVTAPAGTYDLTAAAGGAI